LEKEKARPEWTRLARIGSQCLRVSESRCSQTKEFRVLVSGALAVTPLREELLTFFEDPNSSGGLEFSIGQLTRSNLEQISRLFHGLLSGEIPPRNRLGMFVSLMQGNECELTHVVFLGVLATKSILFTALHYVKRLIKTLFFWVGL
jgi:hypothetical protein